MVNKQNSGEYMQGVPELLILRLLANHEMYGYEIVRGIHSSTNGELNFGEGVIYPMLHSLQKRRFLTIRREKVNGRPRIYYRLTAKGQKQLESKISDWKRITRSIEGILDGKLNESTST